jgi:ribulose-bisphosphate carboxylase large chain
MLSLSGERLVAVYRILGDGPAVLERARALCVEQTVEFPADLLPPGPIPDAIVGRIEGLEPGSGFGLVRVSYAVETAGSELPQLLNLLFGNTSLQPGVRLVGLELPDAVLSWLPGPRYGVRGLRRSLGVFDRPLLASAVKPMGLSPGELAQQAYQLARGGLDLIKDDHGLADQPFCPFAERVARIAEAVRRANAETGGRCRYFANVSSPAQLLLERAEQAREVGAGGLVLAPGLLGWDALRMLAEHPDLHLPIMSHPALQGSFVASPDQGIAHHLLFGLLHRVLGADVVVFPNHGGRFSFSPDQCRGIAASCAAPMGPLRRALPAPAGGMRRERAGELRDFYGSDVVLLIGGDLHRHERGLEAACAQLREAVCGPATGS